MQGSVFIKINTERPYFETSTFTSQEKNHTALVVSVTMDASSWVDYYAAQVKQTALEERARGKPLYICPKAFCPRFLYQAVIQLSRALKVAALFSYKGSRLWIQSLKSAPEKCLPLKNKTKLQHLSVNVQFLWWSLL